MKLDVFRTGPSVRVAKFVSKLKFVGTANASAGSMRAPCVETSPIVHGSAHHHESGMQVESRLYERLDFMRSIAMPAAGMIGKRHRPLPRGTVETAAPGKQDRVPGRRGIPLVNTGGLFRRDSRRKAADVRGKIANQLHISGASASPEVTAPQ
jgi:hypothetical protein